MEEDRKEKKSKKPKTNLLRGNSISLWKKKNDSLGADGCGRETLLFKTRGGFPAVC